MGKSKNSLHVVSKRSLRDESNELNMHSRSEYSSVAPTESASSSSTRKRGRAKCTEIQKLSPSLTASVEFNNLVQPVSANMEKFEGFLGMLARKYVPIDIITWRNVKDDLKDRMFQHVEEKFAYNISRQEFKHYVCQKIENCSRIHRWELRKIVNLNLSLEDNFKKKPMEVNCEQWQNFVRYTFSDEAQELCTKRKGNRACQTLVHNTGRRSYAKIRHIEKDENGNELRPLALFERTHKARNGVNEEASKVIEIATSKLKEKIGENDVSGNQLFELEQQALQETFGPEHSGWLRGFGFGATKTQVYGSKAENSKVAKLEKIIVEMQKKSEESELEIVRLNEKIEGMMNDFEAVRHFFSSARVNGSVRTEPQASCS